MNKLFLTKLHLSGKHGVLEEERKKSQPFEIEVSVEYDFSPALRSGDLKDTIDYQTIERITKGIIEGPSINLLESITEKIAGAVLSETNATTVDVSVAKVQAPSAGVPVVRITKSRSIEIASTTADILGITPRQVQELYSLDTDGILHLKGVLYKILNKEKIQEWYQNKWKEFQKKEEKYIQNNQEVALVYDGPFEGMKSFSSPSEAAIHQLWSTVRNELNRYSEIPFKKGDRLESKLIKYPVSTLGVGAHKDLSSNVNAIILFNLYGKTTFYTASDKDRSNEKGYSVEPGDIVIMRGPRVPEENDLRPIHYVLDIEEERLVFVCREIEDETERIINKGNWMGF